MAFFLCYIGFAAVVIAMPEVLREPFDFTAWKDTLRLTAPTISQDLIFRNVWKPSLLLSFEGLAPDENVATLQSMIGRVPTWGEVTEWNDLISACKFPAAVQRNRIVSALSHPGMRKCSTFDVGQSSPPLNVVLQGFKHKRGDLGRIPKADRKFAKVPNDALRDRLVQRLGEILLSTNLPLVAQLQISLDPSSITRRLCGGLRSSLETTTGRI